jgi:hypothetical protein
MRAPLLYSLLLVAVALPALAGPAAGVSLDWASETRTTLIGLPTSANGTLSYKRCLACPVVVLSATATSAYTIDGRRSSLQALAKILSTGRDYPATVIAKLDAPVLLRLDVSVPDSATGVIK